MGIKKKTLFNVFGNSGTSASRVREILRTMGREQVNVTNSEGRTVLMEAIIAEHDEEVILALLGMQVDPTIVDNDAETALHYAVRYAGANVVERMLELGFDVSVRNTQMQTPLLLAAGHTKDERVIHLLVEHGANIEEKTAGNTGVMLFGVGNKHLNLLPYFRSLGLSDTVINNSGKNCLHNGIIHDIPIERIEALLHLPLVSVPEKPLELTEEQLEYDAYKSRIPSALILASIYHSNPAVLQLLLDHGASVEDCDDVFKRTPLMHTIVNERPIEFIELLIEAGSDLLAVDRDQMTALELAAKYNEETDIFELLLSAYEKLSGAEKVISAAWTLAGAQESYSDFSELFAKYIEKHEVKLLNDLYEDAETKPIVASLMKRWESRADSEHWWYRDGLTPLMIAAREEPVEVVKLLLDRGANINAGLPILEAIDGDVVENFTLFLSRGADVEGIRLGYGMTLFEYAIKNQSNAIVQEMLRTGINSSLEGEYRRTKKAIIERVAGSLDRNKGTVTTNYAVRDEDDIEEYIVGSPPIVLAAIYGDTRTLELLLEAGSNVNIRDFTINKTPLMWAIDAYRWDINGQSNVEYLVSKGADITELRDDDGWNAQSYLLDVFEIDDLRDVMAPSPHTTLLGQWFKEEAILDTLSQDPKHSKLFGKFIPAWEEYRDDGNMALLIPPLSFASREDKWAKVTKLLIANGADVNFTALTGWTPIVFASNASSRKNVHLLVESGADVNILLGNEIKITLLEFILTRLFPNAEIVSSLFSGGAVITGDPNRTIKKQIEALCEQDRDGEIDLENDPYFEDMFTPRDLIGSPAIILAAQHNDEELLQPCLDFGADVDSKDYGPMKRTALMWACQRWIEYFEHDGSDLFDSISDYGARAIKFLIDQGADLMHIKDADGNTGLDYVAQIMTADGFYEFLQYLQTGWKNNDPNLLRAHKPETLLKLLDQSRYGQWFKGTTVLNEPVENPEYASVLEDFNEEISDLREMFVGRDYPFLSNIMLTPLAFAALTENIEVIKLLLDQGADPNVSFGDDIQVTLLEFYLINENFFARPEIVTALIEGGASIEGSPDKTLEKQLEVLRQQGKEIEPDEVEDFFNDYFLAPVPAELIGSPIITIAGYYLVTEVLPVLIEMGADINAHDFTSAKRTALMWACLYYYDDYGGEDFGLLDSICDEEIEKIKFLLDHGVDVTNIKDAEGRTGLDYLKKILSQKGMEDLMKYLRETRGG